MLAWRDDRPCGDFVDHACDVIVRASRFAIGYMELEEWTIDQILRAAGNAIAERGK